jgi:uncharacterized membrane protein
MGLVETVKEQAVNVVGKVVEKAPADATNSQSVTIKCTVVEAEELWRDAHRLSQVLGDVGEVTFAEPDTYRWRLTAGPVDTTWESTLHSDNGGLRFVGTGEDGNEIIVAYRPAPNHLGTEVSLRTKLPAPSLLTGALAFKLLYRARALLQTGEIPTIKQNPGARASER